jgi:hybrid cluster-associated redox disulfide protein
MVYPESRKGCAMDRSTISTDLTIADVLARWPQTVPVFLRYRLACVGCPIAPFEQLADIASNYGLPLDGLLTALQQAIRPSEEPAP